MNGQSLLGAMRDVTVRHAERLEQLGPVAVLALDPCPRCEGRVIASDTAARCTTCGWRFSLNDRYEPVASRRADP